MIALNFQAQFVPAIESGLADLAGEVHHAHRGVPPKRQTIRAYRKDSKDPHYGEFRSLYTGMRTKACRKLGEVALVRVVDLLIEADFVLIDPCAEHGAARTRGAGADLFAQRDGFKSFRAMVEWFDKTHGLPFRGLLLRW